MSNIVFFLGFVIIIEPFDEQTPTIPNPILHFWYANVSDRSIWFSTVCF